MVTAVMYHYVGESNPQFPNRRQMLTHEFRRQVAWLARRYSICSLDDIVAALCRNDPVRPGTCLLTFDDGLRDHVDQVLPILLEMGLPAAFFVPAGVFHDRVLDVHKIQTLLAAAGDSVAILLALAETLREEHWPHLGGDPMAELAQRYGGHTRFDDKATELVKGFLQRGPRQLRGRVLNKLYERYINITEAELAKQLYLTRDELDTLTRAGMSIGGHGLTHDWLSALEPAEQEAEISASRHLASDRSGAPWAFAYPYGDYDATSLALLRVHGCKLAFTTQPVPVADLARPLELGRLDCNDVPYTE